jgi:aspartyl-tRNA(Asn)/glutamyl-tRNA(Gln) amidotransferase subunit B
MSLKFLPYEATILVSDIDTAKYFEEVVAKMGKNKDIKLAVNWITGELFAVLNNKNLDISQSPISAKNLAKASEFNKEWNNFWKNC